MNKVIKSTGVIAADGIAESAELLAMGCGCFASKYVRWVAVDGDSPSINVPANTASRKQQHCWARPSIIATASRNYRAFTYAIPQPVAVTLRRFRVNITQPGNNLSTSSCGHDE